MDANDRRSSTSLPDPKLSSVLSYTNLGYEVKTKSGDKKSLLRDVSVQIRAGGLLAILGPSGAGKSTLLEVMAFRKTPTEGATATLNGRPLTAKSMPMISTFVEQEDALIGVLTVRESVTYTLRLSLPLLSRQEVTDRVNRVLTALGLQSCADQRIGTPISRGISGGQKRRVTAACAMVTFPRILLLDEVTSGLDSTSAREVMSAIRTLAVAEGIIVIATIHQPSLETLSQFTDILMLAEGQTCYLGPVKDLAAFFDRWGRPVGRFNNPSDHAMNFLNNDFIDHPSSVALSSNTMSQAMEMRNFFLSEKPAALTAASETSSVLAVPKPEKSEGFPQAGIVELSDVGEGKAGPFATLFWNTLVLSERSVVNYMRNLLAYGVRLGMYAGMGFMLATIWIRLGSADTTINDRLSVHFYSCAFLAFMSVAGVPAFLEERAVYYRETKNGLYTTLPFIISNTLVNLPFLFFCTLFFSVICYWAIGLHPGGAAFFRFLAFLYIAIMVAESQVLVIAALIPVFVAALAIGAFMNGFWMSLGGYFIKAHTLPPFWRFSFHYADYQRYAFELLVNSDFRGLVFQCKTIAANGACVCAYPSSTPETCTVSGNDVLNYLDIGHISYGKWAGILIAINLIYRIALYFILRFRSE